MGLVEDGDHRMHLVGRRFARYGAAVALLTVAATACGSSSGHKATAGTTLPSGPPIVIGNVAAYTGGTVDETGNKKTLQAWAASVNASGGINGHPVQLIVKDTGGTASGGLTAVKELVEQDHVVAIVGEFDPTDTNWASYIAGTGVPVIGGNPILPTFLSNPNFYPSGGNIVGLSYGVAKEAAKRNGKVAVIYCAEVAACKGAATLMGAIAPAAGAKLVASVAASISATDYTSVCETIKNSGASVYEMGLAGAEAIRVAKACQQIGVTAVPAVVAGVAVNSMASESALQGLLELDAVAPWFDNSTPAAQAFHKVTAKYQPLVGDENDADSMETWVAAQLFQKAASLVTGAVTPDALKAALYSLNGETLGGLAPPLTYTSGKPAFIACYFSYSVQNHQWVANEGLTPTCVPPDVAAKLAGVLAGH